MGRYILDFYCVALRLAIELDGSHHQAVLSDYDSTRTLELKRRGIYVLRIPNELLIRDPELVSAQIQAAIELCWKGEGAR